MVNFMSFFLSSILFDPFSDYFHPVIQYGQDDVLWNRLYAGNVAAHPAEHTDFQQLCWAISRGSETKPSSKICSGCSMLHTDAL